MMNLKLSPKLLSLYGISIIGVIVLFSVVTAYGEHSLNPQPKIDGTYALNMESANLPDCLHQKQLQLNLRQSGIYINALLTQAGETATASAERQPTLSGKWQRDQLVLSGAITTICEEIKHKISIQAQVKDKLVTGQISLSANVTINFTAKLIVPTIATPSKAQPNH